MSRTHIVKAGECLTSIARLYGFPDYKTIYHHGDNEGFRTTRPNPNILLPGEELTIPDPQMKKVAAATGTTHRFRVNFPMKALKVVLLDVDGKPIAGANYTFKVGREVRPGKTDPHGAVNEQVAANIHEAILSLPEHGIVRTLMIGHLDPVESHSGVNARLENQGYASGERGLAAFQEEHDIDPQRDDAVARTRAKLIEKHGC